MGTRSPDKLPSLSRRARRLIFLGLGLIVLMTVGPRLVDVYVNWLWFGEVGFRRVWITVLLTRIATFFVVALVVGGTLFLAMLVAYRSRPVFIPRFAAERPDRAVPGPGDAPSVAVRVG